LITVFLPDTSDTSNIYIPVPSLYHPLYSHPSQNPFLEELSSRMQKEGDVKNSNFECILCRNNNVDTMFNCGHTCCVKCAHNLLSVDKICHMCKQIVTTCTKMFF